MSFEKGQEVEIREDNRMYPETYTLDELNGELGFFDVGIWVPLNSINGTIRAVAEGDGE